MLRLCEIFFRHARVFAAVRSRPKWPAPYFGTVLLYTATIVLIIQTAGIELLTLQRFERNAKVAAQAGENGIENAVNSSNSRFPKLVVVSRTVGFASLGLLLLAAGLTAAAAALSALPKPGYARMLATTSYSAFPFAVTQLAGSWILLSTGVDFGAYDLDHVVSFNATRFFDVTGTTPATASLMESLDLFMIAQVLFLAYGFARVTALPYVKCLLVCLGFWAVAALGNAAFASLF